MSQTFTAQKFIFKDKLRKLGQHPRGANYVFTDGHGKWLAPGELGNAAPGRKVYTFRYK